MTWTRMIAAIAASVLAASVSFGQYAGYGAPNGTAGNSLDMPGNLFYNLGVGVDALDPGSTGRSTETYTIAMWLQADNIGGEKWAFGQTSQGIHLGTRDDGRLHQAHWGNDHSATSVVPVHDAGAGQNDGWFHATYTFDANAAGDKGRVFLNGTFDGWPGDRHDPSTKLGFNQSNTGQNFILGARNSDNNNAWDGRIDDLALFDKVLTDAEIANLAAGTSSPGALGAGLHWNFDDASNTAVASGPGLWGAGANHSFTVPPPPPPPEGAYDLADGNWNVRTIAIGDGANDQINSTNEAVDILCYSPGTNIRNGGAYNASLYDGNPAWNIILDAFDTRDRIDIAGGGGTFPSNHPYSDGNSAPSDGNDFMVHAQSDKPFHFPQGTYSIAFGSDDGGGIHLRNASGATFTFDSEFGTRAELGGDAVDNVAYDNNPRGHTWTGGTFTVTEAGGMDVFIDAIMFERGGGDSFEIAVASGESSSVANGAWRTLSGNPDDNFGVSVSVGQFLRSPNSAVPSHLFNYNCPVPEPSGLALMLSMVLGLAGMVRRR